MKEKAYSPLNGYLALVILLGMVGFPVYMMIAHEAFWWAIMGGLGLFGSAGLLVVNPNESMVMVLFGAYKGTVRKNGFFWVNPFFTRKKISLRARNLDSAPIKVNDKVGNPIMIGIVLVWRVEETYKAAFEVDDYVHFVDIQTEAAIRKLAGHYPYDNFDDEMADITLRSGGEEVNHVLEEEIRERLPDCSIEVLTPDFQGDRAAIARVMRARPEIFNHNMETVRRLHAAARPGGRYERSLDVLRTARRLDDGVLIKTGIMLGLGETEDDVREFLADALAAGVQILTLGQYLRPSERHMPIDRYVTPEEFAAWRSLGEEMGFLHVESGPLVRSSYHAREQVEELRARAGAA